jgi:hypothetical protein
VSRQDIIRDACIELSLPVPDPTAGTMATDDQVKLLGRLVTAEGRALAKRYPWQILLRQYTFLTIAQPGQEPAAPGVVGYYSIPADFDRLVPETVYDHTLRKYCYGPIDGIEWAAIQGRLTTMVNPGWRIMMNRFFITPTPPAGNLWAYEYVTKNWAYGAGGVAKDRMDSDNDATFLDEEAMTLGVVYRFRADKGHEFGDDLREYERRVGDLILADGSKPRLQSATVVPARVPTPPVMPETIVFP